MAGNTTDVQVFDGTKFVSISGFDGADGKPIDTVEVNPTTVPPTDCKTLADVTGLGTGSVADNANGNLTLTLNVPAPAGLCGADGTTPTVDVDPGTTALSVKHTDPLKVTVTDEDPTSDVSLKFDFEIPKGEPGTGITIKGSVGTEALLPDCSTYAGDEGDMYIVALNNAGDAGHGFVYNGKDSDCWDDVGQIKGQDGTTPDVQAEVKSTTPVPCGSPATATAGRKAGSTDEEPIIEFTFGIPNGCDGDGVSLTSSVTVDMSQCQDAFPISSANGAFATDGAPVNGVQAYALTLNLPRPPKVTKASVEPATDNCVGDFWVVTD